MTSALGGISLEILIAAVIVPEQIKGGRANKKGAERLSDRSTEGAVVGKGE